MNKIILLITIIYSMSSQDHIAPTRRQWDIGDEVEAKFSGEWYSAEIVSKNQGGGRYWVTFTEDNVRKLTNHIRQQAPVPETGRQEDTVPVPKTGRQEDTVPVPETGRQEDTVLVPETGRQEDTVPVPQTGRQEDTVLVPKTGRREDTVPVPETGRQEDTVPVSETGRQEDTVPVPETGRQQAPLALPKELAYGRGKRKRNRVAHESTVVSTDQGIPILTIVDEASNEEKGNLTTLQKFKDISFVLDEDCPSSTSSDHHQGRIQMKNSVDQKAVKKSKRKSKPISLEETKDIQLNVDESLKILEDKPTAKKVCSNQASVGKVIIRLRAVFPKCYLALKRCFKYELTLKRSIKWQLYFSYSPILLLRVTLKN